jgi:hypothetical protein
MARPKKIIDYSTVEKLAAIMCTQEEIASYLDISARTLQRDDEFCRIYKKGLDKGRMSIRRHQYKLLEAGNATMGIWLGKQYLGQSDKQEVKHGGGVEINTGIIEKYLKDEK